MGLCESKNKNKKEKKRIKKPLSCLLSKKRKKIRRENFFSHILYSQDKKKTHSISKVLSVDINNIYLITDEVIGEGEYGKVKICYLKKYPEKKFAVKIIEKSDSLDIQKLETELQILRDSDHPNIVNFCEFFPTKDRIYIIMEYCEGGNLKAYLKKERRIEENKAKELIFQICRALYYLHNIGIAHRDVKLENFVFADKECTRLKLIDFGLARDYVANNLVTYLGTPYYVCPEILQSKPYDQKCDTWSLGVCCFKLLVGDYPFTGNDFKQLFSNILKKNYSLKKIVHLSPSCQDFLENLLKKDPKERITMHNVINHNWFSDFHLAQLNKAKQLLNFEMIENFKEVISINKFVLHLLKIVILFRNPISNIADFELMFLYADSSSSGLLTKNGLQNFLKEFNVVLNSQEMDNIFNSLSLFEENFITFSEFLIACVGRDKIIVNDSYYQFLFDFFDIHDRKVLYLADFEEVYNKFGFTVDEDFFIDLVDCKQIQVLKKGITYETFRDFLESNLSKTKSFI